MAHAGRFGGRRRGRGYGRGGGRGYGRGSGGRGGDFGSGGRGGDFGSGGRGGDFNAVSAVTIATPCGSPLALCHRHTRCSSLTFSPVNLACFANHAGCMPPWLRWPTSLTRELQLHSCTNACTNVAFSSLQQGRGGGGRGHGGQEVTASA